MFEVFEIGVELDAIDDFFPAAGRLVSNPDGIQNVINIVLDAVFSAVVVDVSVVLDDVNDNVVDSDDVDAVVATVVPSERRTPSVILIPRSINHKPTQAQKPRKAHPKCNFPSSVNQNNPKTTVCTL